MPALFFDFALFNNESDDIGYGKTLLRTAIFQLFYALRKRRYCLQLDLRKMALLE